MNLIKRDIDDAVKMWNTHVIRVSMNAPGVGGIPDELFYLPTMHGQYYHTRTATTCHSVFLIQVSNSILLNATLRMWTIAIDMPAHPQLPFQLSSSIL